MKWHRICTKVMHILLYTWTISRWRGTPDSMNVLETIKLPWSWSNKRDWPVSVRAHAWSLQISLIHGCWMNWGWPEVCWACKQRPSCSLGRTSGSFCVHCSFSHPGKLRRANTFNACFMCICKWYLCFITALPESQRHDVIERKVLLT